MRGFGAVLAALLVVGVWACSRSRSYELQGQVIAVDRGRQELTVRHEDIKGFMPAMTMPFKVREGRSVEGLERGDLIRATLIVGDAEAYLTGVQRTGRAPLDAVAPAAAGLDLLEPGEPIPDAAFVDQTGSPRRISDWRGQVLLVTFTYTRCPLPDFCPLIDRHFAAVHRAVAADPALRARTHLVSISFDPEFDTPRVLADHARALGANPALWSFLTGDREEVDRFASRFGVSVMRDDPAGREIVHNLRTAVVDGGGRLVGIIGGNEWKPADLLDAIKKAAALR